MFYLQISSEKYVFIVLNTNKIGHLLTSFINTLAIMLIYHNLYHKNHSVINILLPSHAKLMILITNVSFIKTNWCQNQYFITSNTFYTHLHKMNEICIVLDEIKHEKKLHMHILTFYNGTK